MKDIYIRFLKNTDKPFYSIKYPIDFKQIEFQDEEKFKYLKKGEKIKIENINYLIEEVVFCHREDFPESALEVLVSVI